MFVFRSRLRGFVLGAVRSASLRGTCGRAVAFCRALVAPDFSANLMALTKSLALSY
ncbi:hypothetical protein [Aurantiacibacter sp. D1-12]|uniref:hypothetical protein n=1 Tax=Aurantiacibacter sp. D1-12 TaxID=2993658 RepID=UPI00237CB341|nr:hypothetical protein [Aurantiacibacter sp. D1-12]MDE1467946.1 hypothetical protein [Aurantiacibacter sp. D1-12]